MRVPPVARGLTGSGPRSCRRLALAMLVCVLPVLQPLAARADSLKSRLNTAWEVLWDERGTPQRVFRWREGVLR